MLHVFAKIFSEKKWKKINITQRTRVGRGKKMVIYNLNTCHENVCNVNWTFSSFSIHCTHNHHHHHQRKQHRDQEGSTEIIYCESCVCVCVANVNVRRYTASIDIILYVHSLAFFTKSPSLYQSTRFFCSTSLFSRKYPMWIKLVYVE